MDFPGFIRIVFHQRLNVSDKTLFSVIRKAVPLTTSVEFADATSPMAEVSRTDSLLAKHICNQRTLSVFRFDVTPFDESFFADLYKENE